MSIAIRVGILLALFLAFTPAPIDAQSQRVLIDDAALGRLRTAAEAAHSDAVVVLKDGQEVAAWYFGRIPGRLAAMSITKSVVSLAIGRLMTTHAITSIDDPVFKYYPEWRQGQKQNITLRHLLNHTSGLQDPGNSNDVERSHDAVRLALAAELSDPPGTHFAYNNKAVNLLSGIVQKVSGKRMDLYMREELFAPLGITDVSWELDSAGNALAYAGLTIRPADLAKLGQLVLDRGRWRGNQLIASEWFDDALRASPLDPRGGLLWWLVPERTTWVIDDARLDTLRRAGADSAFLRRAAAIRGRYPSLERYIAALRGTFGSRFWEPLHAGLKAARTSDLARPEYGRMVGYEANGYLGQFLVIYPESGIVAVRMIRASDRFNPDTDSFDAFRDLVRALIP
ncbi:MAG TPA: serine hydrolase [Gemmatimonadaceae bacterium]|nr:serine hydrolase [Gemmatimonadaceae bacterium]